jgi:hypothetical protein
MESRYDLEHRQARRGIDCAIRPDRGSRCQWYWRGYRDLYAPGRNAADNCCAADPGKPIAAYWNNLPRNRRAGSGCSPSYERAERLSREGQVTAPAILLNYGATPPHVAPNVQEVDFAVRMHFRPLGSRALVTDDDHRDQ